MPYTKTLTEGKKEIYQITRIHISLSEKQVQGEIDHIDYNEQNIPKVEKINYNVRNEDNQILDPSWNAQSQPPKPEGFVYTNPDTWGNLTVDQIPRIINEEKQYFNKLVSKTGSEGATIYERIKRVLYGALIELNILPGDSSWTIE